MHGSVAGQAAAQLRHGGLGPRGPIIFGMINDEIVQHRFRAKQDILEREGRWSLAEVTALLHIISYGEPELTHRAFVYRVT